MHEIVLIIGLFLMLVFLPLILPFAELFLKKDAKPIPIDIKRRKEPDYFGKSFMNILTTASNDLKIQEVEKLNPVCLNLKLSREEWVCFLNDESLLEKTVDMPIVFTKDVIFMQNHTFRRELAVLGNAVFKNACVIRSLYVKGDCVIDAPIRIARWVHVEGTLIVNSYADLGVSVYTREIKINSRATFKRAYAQKIETLNGRLINKKNNDANLQENFGSKVPIIINGNIFRDDDIEIEGDVWIKGNVFSQKNVILKNGVVVGEEGKVKSVVARDKMLIKGPFRIYGYLHSEDGVEVSV
jgi:cytoskeletal protein CcmA (bactofilin family)